MAGATKNEMSTSVLKTFEEKFFDMASLGNASDVKVYLKGNAPVNHLLPQPLPTGNSGGFLSRKSLL